MNCLHLCMRSQVMLHLFLISVRANILTDLMRLMGSFLMASSVPELFKQQINDRSLYEPTAHFLELFNFKAPRREAGGFLMSPSCLESQGCKFDPTFLYLLSCSSA